MQLVDTHSHIQFADYKLDPEKVIADGLAAGVTKALVVGCRLDDSRLGIALAEKHPAHLWATIGLHPHEAQEYAGDEAALAAFAGLVSNKKVVAIGECGLDYFYEHSPKPEQLEILKFQIELAQQYDLPMSFHVRDSSLARQGDSVWDDFWPIFEQYHTKKPIHGVLHSFTDSLENMQRAVSQGLYIGVNGIATFAKPDQQAVYAAVPIDHLLLETDAPFLTPKPYRGTICELKHVRVTAEFLSELRGVSLDELAAATTQNAQTLFNLT